MIKEIQAKKVIEYELVKKDERYKEIQHRLDVDYYYTFENIAQFSILFTYTALTYDKAEEIIEIMRNTRLI